MRRVSTLALLQSLLAGGALAQGGAADFPPCAQAAPVAAETDARPTPLPAHPLANLEPRLAALLARGVEGGSVTMAVAAAPLPASALGSEAALAVVEVSAASLAEAHPGGCLGVEIALLAVAAGGRVVASRYDGVAIEAPAGVALGVGGLRYLARLELPPGETSLRALVRVERTGAFALRASKLTVPVAPPSAPAAARPETWIEVLAPGTDAGQVATLAAAGALPAPLAGHSEAVAPATVTRLPATSPSAELDELATLVDGHLAALRLLAQGRSQEAVAALERLDAGALEADPDNGLGRVTRAGERVLGGIASRHRRALLPVALFFADLSRAHHATRRSALARRAAIAAEHALERLASSPPTPEDRELVAAALDGLAADDLRHGDPSHAILLLVRAAELDPARAPRWLALAVLYEWDWRLDAAARAVGRALEHEPGNREALLRAARIARLQAEPRLAAERLEPLLAAPTRDWVQAVAAEERARLAFDEGRPEAAVPALESASDLLPEEAPLAAALAFARFRSGDRSGAFAAAAHAAEAGQRSRVAPRRRYGELPLAVLLRSRTAAEAGALLRLDTLGLAVTDLERRR